MDTGHVGERLDRDPEALPLLEPSHEQQVTPGWKRGRARRGEPVHVDAVRHDQQVAIAHAGTHALAGRVRHGDTPGQPVPHRPHHRRGQPEPEAADALAAHVRMKRGHHRGVGLQHRVHRHARHQRLVHVDDVRRGSPQRPADRAGHLGAEADARDRAVATHRNCATDDQGIAARTTLTTRREDLHLVPERPQVRGQLPHVDLHAAGDVPAVRRDLDDAQRSHRIRAVGARDGGTAAWWPRARSRG